MNKFIPSVYWAVLTFAFFSTAAFGDGTIAVSGEAAVYVKPDKIVIRLGIETNDMDIIVSKTKNTEITRKVIAAVKECGVAEKDMQTDNLSIEPRWRDSYQHDNFLGYWSRNSLAVTTTDANKVEEILTKSLQAGATYIHGVDFQTTELRKYRDKARLMAVKAAKEKAEDMAGALDQAIGSPTSINEQQEYSYYWGGWSGWGWSGGRGQQGMSQNASYDVPGSNGNEPADTVVMGKIAVRARVNVSFQLKEKK